MLEIYALAGALVGILYFWLWFSDRDINDGQDIPLAWLIGSLIATFVQLLIAAIVNWQVADSLGLNPVTDLKSFINDPRIIELWLSFLLFEIVSLIAEIVYIALGFAVVSIHERYLWPYQRRIKQLEKGIAAKQRMKEIRSLVKELADKAG